MASRERGEARTVTHRLGRGREGLIAVIAAATWRDSSPHLSHEPPSPPRRDGSIPSGACSRSHVMKLARQSLGVSATPANRQKESTRKGTPRDHILVAVRDQRQLTRVGLELPLHEASPIRRVERGAAVDRVE